MGLVEVGQIETGLTRVSLTVEQRVHTPSDACSTHAPATTENSPDEWMTTLTSGIGGPVRGLVTPIGPPLTSWKEMPASIDFRRLSAWFQTKQSPKIDLITLAKLCMEAGWDPSEAVFAVAVCGAESGYRIRARNVDKRHGQEDYGLFQINEIHKPDMTQIYDPQYNVSQAFRIWQRQGWGAWMAYRAGKHLAFIPMAEEAVTQALRN